LRSEDGSWSKQGRESSLNEFPDEPSRVFARFRGRQPSDLYREMHHADHPLTPARREVNVEAARRSFGILEETPRDRFPCFPVRG
jgi:hypothetical protein